MQKLLAIVLLMLPFSIMAQTNIKITGNVIDRRTNKPLSGVSVTQFGSTNSTLTDSDGNYEITAPDNAKLMFKHAKHTSILLAIRGRNDVSIRMREGDPSKLVEYFVVSGRVYDIKTGAPVEGVSISQDDTDNIAKTDASGNYTMLISDEDDPDLEFKHRKYYIEKKSAQKHGTLDIPMHKFSRHEFSVIGGAYSAPCPLLGRDGFDDLMMVSVNVSYLTSIAKWMSVGLVYSHGFKYSFDVHSDEDLDVDNNSLMFGMRIHWHSGTHLRLYSKFAAGFSKYNWTYTHPSTYYDSNNRTTKDSGTEFDFQATAFGITAGGQHLKALVEVGFGSCGMLQAGVVYEF